MYLVICFLQSLTPCAFTPLTKWRGTPFYFTHKMGHPLYFVTGSMCKRIQLKFNHINEEKIFINFQLLPCSLFRKDNWLLKATCLLFFKTGIIFISFTLALVFSYNKLRCTFLFLYPFLFTFIFVHLYLYFPPPF